MSGVNLMERRGAHGLASIKNRGVRSLRLIL
jgi:hypothetical protein